MLLKAKQSLLFLRSLKNLQGEEGFTLVELIVVVMVIGILSSIAVPQFMSATEKARQSEANTIVNASVKAAQAYYAEYGSAVTQVGHLANYFEVIECRMHMISWCKDSNQNTHRNMSSFPSSKAWNSPSGYFTINMRDSNSTRFLIRAFPQTQSWSRKNTWNDTGFGVSGCFNYSTGASKVISWRKPDYKNVITIQC